MCLSCEIPWKAVVKFTEVPTTINAAQQTVMESQLRHAYTITEIIHGVAELGKGKEVCLTLSKATLSRDDLDFLNDAGRALFDPSYQ
jgi:hypothetical protein